MSKTYIIDGNSLLFRSYYSTSYTGNLMVNKDGIPTNAIYAFHNLINKIKSDLGKGDHIFVSFDTRKPSFRKQEYAEYKAQRSKAPDELVIQMPIARELLDAMNIFWLEKDGYEGDDLAGSMAKIAAQQGDQVILFSSDKDFLQLLDLGENITVRFLKKGLSEVIDYNKNNLHSLFGIYPNQVVDFKGIAGDPSDNYLGIKGVGEKTTFKLLNEFGNIENIVENAKKDPSNKLNLKLIEGEKEALFFKKLATIITDIDLKEEYEKSSYIPYDENKLTPFYLKYQFNQFLSKISSMHDIVLNQQQLSLFNTEAKKNEVISIGSLSEIKEDIEGITFDSSEANENVATLYSFFLISNSKIYKLPLEKAKKDSEFNKYLQSEKSKIVFDLKGLNVLLFRNSFPFVNNPRFDLLIATYLLNPDFGQKKEEIFFFYNRVINKDENFMGEALYTSYQLEEEVTSTLKEQGEYDLFKNVELPLSFLLAKMEIEGFPIDTKILTDIEIEYNKKIEQLKSNIYSLVGKEFNINSPKQLEDILFVDLGIKKYKGEKGTGSEVLLSHIYDHEVIPLIIEYRLYSKIVSTYTSALPKHVGSDNKIHAIYNQALTSTGRLSMSEPNLQNISIRNEEGKQLRKAFFYPNNDFYLLSIDYSQIELRMLAHLAKIKDLQEIFAQGYDIHSATAAKVFNKKIENVSEDERRKAKAVNFGIIYGISPFGLSTQLGISREEAKNLIESFKNTFNGISQFQEETIKYAKEKGYVKTILNRRRYLKEINSSNFALRNFNERAAINTVIQGSAADLIKVAMLKCEELLKDYKTKIVLQIHDELIFKVPKDEVDIIPEKLQKCMEEAMKLDVPLVADKKVANTWYEVH